MGSELPWSGGVESELGDRTGASLLSLLVSLSLVSLLPVELSDEDSESLYSFFIAWGMTALPCFRGNLPDRFLRGGVGGFGVRNSASFFFSRASFAFLASPDAFFLRNMATCF